MSKTVYSQDDIHSMEIAAGEHIAEKYTEAYETLFYEATRNMVADIASSGNPGRIKLLELGCGTGNLTKFLFQKPNCAVTAVDISPDMIRQAQKKLKNVEFHASPIERLPFEDGSFDVVTGYSVLHHLPDLRGSFDEIRRVLKPNGSFVFGEPVESVLDKHKNLYRALKVPFYPLYLFIKKKNSRDLAVFTDVNFDSFLTPIHGHLSEKGIVDAVANSGAAMGSIVIRRMGIISPWLGCVLFKSKGFDRMVFKPIWHFDMVLGRVLSNFTSEMIITGKVKKEA